MLAEAVNQTVGVGLGVFIGTLIGVGLRARKGQRSGLVQDSVWKTAVLAGMAAWAVSAVVALFV